MGYSTASPVIRLILHKPGGRRSFAFIPPSNQSVSSIIVALCEYLQNLKAFIRMLVEVDDDFTLVEHDQWFEIMSKSSHLCLCLTTRFHWWVHCYRIDHRKVQRNVCKYSAELNVDWLVELKKTNRQDRDDLHKE